MASAGFQPVSLPPLAQLAAVDLSPQVLKRPGLIGLRRSDPKSRAFSLLRTQLAKVMAQTSSRLIGITSPLPQAGKSFLALNLAASLARVSEEPIYLVDLDFRRPTLASELELDASPGLAEYLAGAKVTLAEIGRRIEPLKLGVFPAGIADTNSAELLASAAFSALIGCMRSTHSGAIIICDLPPVFAEDDAMLAIQKLDGYVLVADSGHTSSAQVTEAMRLLEPAPCLGTILNRYRGKLTDAYSYGRSYGEISKGES